MATAPGTPRQRYEEFLRARHRPNFGRRTASSHAGFLLPHLAADARVLDLGCGPGSITAGLGDGAIGIDLEPGPRAGVPLATADVGRLPFPDATFDAVFSCAVLQHLVDPMAALREAARVCRPGAVIGVADADWGGQLRWPDEPLIDRGHEIQEALRQGASPYVGGRLRGLLHEAGFVDATTTARGSGGGSAGTAFQAEWNATLFEAPELVAVCEDEGIATAAELRAVAAAWRRWGADPAATMGGWWVEAIARKPG